MVCRPNLAASDSHSTLISFADSLATLRAEFAVAAQVDLGYKSSLDRNLLESKNAK